MWLCDIETWHVTMWHRNMTHDVWHPRMHITYSHMNIWPVTWLTHKIWCVTWLTHKIWPAPQDITYVKKRNVWVSQSHMWMRHHHASEFVLAPPLRHTKHLNKSRHTYWSCVLHIWMSHVTRMSSDPCATCATQYTMWMSHVALMNGSCRIYE